MKEVIQKPKQDNITPVQQGRRAYTTPLLICIQNAENAELTGIDGKIVCVIEVGCVGPS